MGLLNFILDIVCMLVWVNWLAAKKVATPMQPAVSLLHTLQPTEEKNTKRHWMLVLLSGIIVGRAFFYANVGASLQWVPSINLGAITLSFRSDFAGRMFVFSCLSFVIIFVSFHFWMLLLSSVSHKASVSDPFRQRLRRFLGVFDKLPVWIKLLLPFLCGALLWFLASWYFVYLEIIPPRRDLMEVLGQSAVIGLSSYLVWQYLLIIVFLLHLINSYVYLGNAPFWKYVDTTGIKLLRPLKWLPLSLGKIDFSPLVGIGIVIVISYFAEDWLSQMFQAV
ncbi:MAG: hypothetical protein K9N52_07325 [Verrucomicrobia bacterium]|nr:hypothetical protein [Verrucomicrobiota bacterium]